MRALAVLAMVVACACTWAERILLIPLDSRPASGQFVSLIARMASVDVQSPPYEALGRFTSPGNPERILKWLEGQNFKDVSAVIISTDMIAYGGLIASRTDDVTLDQALGRLKRLAEIRRKAPKTKFYCFSAIMRLAPTATKASAAWRINLARYAELRDMVHRTGSQATLQQMQNLLAKIPANEVQRYEAVRQRDVALQQELIRMLVRKECDFLLFGQDDAKQYGPHFGETRLLKAFAESKQVTSRTFFGEGIDQQANILLSRALLLKAGWKPKLRVVFSDEAGRSVIAPYESKPVEQSLEDQITASGAQVADQGEDYDYSLYLNTPNPGEEPMKSFISALTSEIDQGFPVAVADINIGKDGTADPELFKVLTEEDRMHKLLAYAGWNTAGNTMGTTIPAANVYLLARRQNRNPLQREVAQQEFLLHRFVNDYCYHKFTRPRAYQMIDTSPFASREETYGEAFAAVDRFVRMDLSEYLQDYWKNEFQGRKFFAGSQQYQLAELRDLRVFLPWPRAYEVRLEFRIIAEPVSRY